MLRLISINQQSLTNEFFQMIISIA